MKEYIKNHKIFVILIAMLTLALLSVFLFLLGQNIYATDDTANAVFVLKQTGAVEYGI